MAAFRFRILVLPLLLYVALQPVLALDVSMRLLATWSAQEQGSAALLMFFELTRGLLGLSALAIAALLLMRPVARADARALTLFVLFAEMAYAMATAGSAYAGPFQGWLAQSLLDLGVTRGQLRILFGYPDWALWLALAALLRFATEYPVPLTAVTIEQSGAQDRAGMMRGMPGAGLDVGGLFRALAAATMRRGGLRPGILWGMGGTGALLSIIARAHELKPLLWLPFLFGVALAITCLRATQVSRDQTVRRRLRWAARGALAAFTMIALSALVGLARAPQAASVAFALFTLAPVTLLLGLTLALLQRVRNQNVAPVGS